MSTRVKVAAANELEPGERVLIEKEGQEIAVFNVEGKYYAIENNCCHLGGPVGKGKVTREIDAQFEVPGDRVKERFSDTPTVACPWHGYEYQLETGRHIGVCDVALQTYPVTVENGDIVVDIES